MCSRHRHEDVGWRFERRGRAWCRARRRVRDEAYVAAGAEIVDRDALKLADVVLAVQPLPLADAKLLREGAWC